MGRVKVLGYAYRQWARNLLYEISMNSVEMQIEKEPERVTEDIINNFRPDLILFYGWSWKVPSWVIDNYVSLCLHPSPLPKYRGGSPIQNQILAGELESAVSIFKMTKELDAGPLCAQVKFPLIGSMQEILSRIRNIGVDETQRIINEYMNGGIKYWPQRGKSTVFRRRLPEQSEITMAELKVMSAGYLYNKIRSLQAPYPNAYITCADGKKLYLTEAHLG